MNKLDPIVDEIHRLRQEHAATYDYDLKRIVEDMRKKAAQIAPDAKIIKLPPKRVAAKSR